MKILLLVLSFIISPTGYTQQASLEDIYLSIDEMVRSNIISEVEGKKTKLRFQSSKKEFLKTTNRMPASIEDQIIDSYQGHDLSKSQMLQIRQDIDVIYKKVSD